MHPKIIKLTVPKHTLAKRDAVWQWLSVHEQLRHMPPSRHPADAGRISASYLHKYRQHVSVMCYDDYSREQFGANHLFEGDLRRLAYALVEDEVDPLWHGLWLCLSHAPGLAHVAELDTLVIEGCIALRTLTLADRQANQEVIAEALGQTYREHLAVADCIYNQPGLQSAHFSDHINCIYRRTQDRIICL